jgi:hypothetical protein
MQAIKQEKAQDALSKSRTLAIDYHQADAQFF